MHSPETNGITYYLPLKITSHFAPILHIICLLILGGCVGIWFVPQIPLWVQIVFAVFGVAILGLHFYTAVLHRCWMQLNANVFYCHLPFYTVSIPLTEVSDVAVRSSGVFAVLRIITIRAKRYRIPIFLFGGVSADILENTLQIASEKSIAALPVSDDTEEEEVNILKYPMPFKLHSKMSMQQHAFWIFYNILFLAMTLVCFLWITEMFWGGFFFLFCFIFGLSLWLYNGVLQKAYIYGDENELRIKQFLSKTKHIPWKSIALIDFVDTGKYGAVYPRAGKGTHLRIVTYAADGKINSTQFLLRRNPNLHLIQLAMFQTIRPYVFVTTICEQVEQHKAKTGFEEIQENREE